jgi:hypothetical protein
MEVTKQTATQWLFNNLKSHFEHDGDLLEIVQFSFEQVKEMEKEQIIDSYRDGRSDQQSDRQSRFYNRMAEQYYNETYGKAN